MKTASFIDDIIHETLRLKSAIASGSPRVTPPEGIVTNSAFSLGDTNVVVPPQPNHTHSRYWENAEELIANRFGEKRAEMKTNGKPYMPFTLGAYLCPGYGLELMSLRLALSMLLREFDIISPRKRTE